MNIDKIANKIANSKIADASQQYKTKLQSCRFAFEELKKAIIEHGKKQKLNSNDLAYVGDLNHLLSQLNQLTDNLNER